MIFARLQEIWIWINEKEGNDVSLTAGPACQVRLPHDRDDVHRRFLCDDEVSGQTKGTNVIPRPLRTGWAPFPHGRATGKGLPSTMAARRKCSALRRSSQAGRAWPRVSYSTSELRRNYLGRWLGLQWCGTNWPREGRTPAETRRRCASCPATVSAVERPASGASTRYGPKLALEPNQRRRDASRSSALSSPEKKVTATRFGGS